MIEIQNIGYRDSAYTTEISGAINLYNTDKASGLTLGQLMIAVSCRQAAAIEARGVAMMNKISRDAYLMKDYAAAMDAVIKASETDDYVDNLTFVDQAGRELGLYDYLVENCGVGTSELPAKNDANTKARNKMTPTNKTLYIGVIKTLMEKTSATSQQDNIQLKSLINSRDIAFKTSTGLVSALGNSQSNIAETL